MIVTVGGIKGGSGKTTVATNLAIMRALSGHDVLLIDADDQESASDFTNLRHETHEKGSGYTCIQLTGNAVRHETLKLKSKYTDIIIDTGGRDTTSQRADLSVCDRFIVPFVPRSFDIWTIERVESLIQDMRLANPLFEAYMFLNRCDSRGGDNKMAEEILKDAQSVSLLPVFLGARKAFGNAASKGLSVVELKPVDEKAYEEINKLYECIFNTKIELNKNDKKINKNS